MLDWNADFIEKIINHILTKFIGSTEHWQDFKLFNY